MPTYDYKCRACGYEFEAFQKMTDELLSECPECGGEVKRLIGAGLGPIFKGTGFYQTDYKNNGNGSKTAANVESKETSANKTDTKKQEAKKEKPA